MSGFAAVHRRAIDRKGGKEALDELLPPVPPPDRLAVVPDDRVLSEMARCLFQAGFVWKVIDAKWPGFETVFHAFDPKTLLALPPDGWDAIASDERIVRNAQKIRAVRDNAGFVAEVSAGHDGFGRFLADWPTSDLTGLFGLLKKRGARLGGITGQRLLRNLGKDTFILSPDVVAALIESGAAIDREPTSKRDLAAVQDTFNAWHAESGLPYTHLSKIAAFSTGGNRVEGPFEGPLP